MRSPMLPALIGAALAFHGEPRRATTFLTSQRPRVSILRSIASRLPRITASMGIGTALGAPLASILATGLGYHRHGALVAGCLLLPYLAATLLVRSDAVRELGTGIPILNYALVVFLIVLFGRVTFPALKNTLTREILVNLRSMSVCCR